MHNDVKMTAHICDVQLSVVTSALQTSHFPCYCLVCIFALSATKSADKLSISFQETVKKNSQQKKTFTMSFLDSRTRLKGMKIVKWLMTCI